ncbi:MAG: lysophospholipid acyltransferase family protein [Myxococcales bacterium]|nr:lysophospholipid acyltransferase family protein [Myxococcales bacterium]
MSASSVPVGRAPTASAPTATPQPSPAPARPAPGPLEDVDVRPYIRRDPWHRKLARRSVSVTLLHLFTLVWWGVAPVVLPILVVVDLIRRRPLLLARFYLCIGAIVFGQTWGMWLLLSVWLASGFGLAWRRQNRLLLRAEAYWSDWNARVMAAIYGITYDVEGTEVLRDGPSLLLMRHASTNDTILPIGLATHGHGVRLRIVLKAELLWAPIVDGIGHRVPTAFIRRSSGDPARELEAVRAITPELHAREAIMIFPEGTRFSPERRAQIIAKLRTKDPAAAAEAEALTHVLPFRTGGTMALMEGAPDAALVFCAHTGYERSARLDDFVAGGLYRCTVKVKMWRVAAADVPTEPEARAAFLRAEWRKVNAWVAQHQVAQQRN